MKYRYLGKSGLSVSRVCLGTMTFGQEGWGTDAESSESILDAFFEEGGNFVDTADKYAGGRSETIIGGWMSSRRRDEVVLATKCYFPTGGAPNDRGLSRKHVIAACEASLKRLRTDFIDLYQLHAPDPNTPLEETLSALDILVKQGKVRYTGVSNFPAWLLMKGQSIVRSGGYTPLISGQYLYNLLKRDVESEVLPACVEAGVGMLCWSPLSGGMLTGKYPDADKPPPDTRLSTRAELSRGRYREWFEKSCALVSKIVSVAKMREVSPAVVSLAWLLRQEGVAAVVVGSSRIEQVRLNAAAAEFELKPDEAAALDEASRSDLGYPESWIRSTHEEVFGRAD